MLAILAYHRIGQGKHCNSLAMLESHFAYIQKHFPVLLPGEKMHKRGRHICLTFDDASYDFYHYVFPLLKKYDLRALLAVPTNYILEDTLASPEDRLAVPYTLAMQEGIYERKAPFCTWKELKEMVLSGHVEIAAHSHLHCNLTFDFVDLKREIVRPREIIEKHLSCSVHSFVYPFGRHSESAHRFVMKEYLYAFRLGFSYNFTWQCQKEPLRRIGCDQLASPKAPFGFKSHLFHFIKTII